MLFKQWIEVEEKQLKYIIYELLQKTYPLSIKTIKFGDLILDFRLFIFFKE